MPRVREVHNLVLVDVAGLKELSLHVKLPGSLSLDEAHAIAEQVEDAIRMAVPEIQGVQTHLEPLTEAMTASEVDADAAAVVLRVVEEATGSPPAGAAVPAHGRRPRRVPDPRPRRRQHPRRGARPRQRDRGADPT